MADLFGREAYSIKNIDKPSCVLTIGLMILHLSQPMPDVPMDPIPFFLIENFVPPASVEPVIERQMALTHVAGDELLDRPGLAADEIVSPGDDQDRQADGNMRFTPRKPEIVESLEDRIGHTVRERLPAKRIGLEQADFLGVAGLPLGTRGIGDVLDEWRVEAGEQFAEELAGHSGVRAGSERMQFMNDTFILGIVEPGYGAHGAAQDRAGKQVAVVLDM